MRAYLIVPETRTVDVRVYGGQLVDVEMILGTKKLDFVELDNGHWFIASDEDDDDDATEYFEFEDWGAHYQTALIVGPQDGDRYGDIRMTRGELLLKISWGSDDAA